MKNTKVLSDPIIIMLMLLLVVVSCGVTAYLLLSSSSGSPRQSGALTQRDFDRLPFDQLDAEYSCINFAHEREGQPLVQPVVDELSTRFESKRGIFLIFLDAKLRAGKNQLRDVQVYCYIDPATYEVTYYKSIGGESGILGQIKDLFAHFGE
ncbi:hypothetical protein [Marinibactrum halimedae]|uniref:Uncharacterized protein n=1 Tax=Marinibactrum halimedae TaxID=1444977 RepID=A0AA37T517_9GAMM|nr:hypothetical protein [Marinibactrum halimedae]MCD9458947.1 hypothetical protein [Marinibactrum halimedae]GLS26924.1 hypothetical protein GCM10007877_26430 [Marinibactrum halimedae]